MKNFGELVGDKVSQIGCLISSYPNCADFNLLK